MSEPALAIEELCYRYGEKVALDAISLQLDRGEFVAVLGPNGAGKSTLMALLTRLLLPATGSVRVFGHSLCRQPGAALARVGVVFQESTLDLDLSVEQNLHYHGALRGMSARSLRPRIREELRRFGVDDCARLRMRQLNGGHRRRVELARALLHRPSLLLLDEPTAGLDPNVRRSLRDHVRELCAEDGVAVLWTTHMLDEVEARDSVVFLHRGEQLASGNCGGLLARHRAPDAHRLFDKLMAVAP